jgi:hypothetical protein
MQSDQYIHWDMKFNQYNKGKYYNAYILLVGHMENKIFVINTYF